MGIKRKTCSYTQHAALASIFLYIIHVHAYLFTEPPCMVIVVNFSVYTVTTLWIGQTYKQARRQISLLTSYGGAC